MTNILISILITHTWDCVYVSIGFIMRSVKLEPLLYRDIAGRLRQRRLCSVVQRSLCSARMWICPHTCILMFVIVVVFCLMRSFLIAVVCMSDSLRASAQIYTVTTSSVPCMDEKRKICKLKAYDKYIKKFKSDWEAAGLFLSDEGLLSEKADVFFFFIKMNHKVWEHCLKNR